MLKNIWSSKYPIHHPLDQLYISNLQIKPNNNIDITSKNIYLIPKVDSEDPLIMKKNPIILLKKNSEKPNSPKRARNHFKLVHSN